VPPACQTIGGGIFHHVFRTEAIMELNELFASERISFFAGGLMLLLCWAMDYCTGGDDWQ
jgi:hypothetical protein